MAKAVWAKSAEASYSDLRSAAEASLKNRQEGGKASKAEGLFKQVKKAIDTLLSNPRHPSLNTHKFDAIENPYKKGDPVFEAYAQNNTPSAYRLFWCYGPNNGDITIIAITPHP